jgi:hypothetical protein
MEQTKSILLKVGELMLITVCSSIIGYFFWGAMFDVL